MCGRRLGLMESPESLIKTFVDRCLIKKNTIHKMITTSIKLRFDTRYSILHTGRVGCGPYMFEITTRPDCGVLVVKTKAYLVSAERSRNMTRLSSSASLYNPMTEMTTVDKVNYRIDFLFQICAGLVLLYLILSDSFSFFCIVPCGVPYKLA